MTLPHRSWTRFHIRTLERMSPDNAEDSIDKWTATHYKKSIVGDYTENPVKYWSWKTIFRPSEVGFGLLAGMDEIIDYGITFSHSLVENTAGVSTYELWWEALHRHLTEAWKEALVSGKYYDGENPWDLFPMYTENPDGDLLSVNVGNLPISTTLWINSQELAAGKPGNSTQADLFRNGLVFYIVGGTYDIGDPSTWAPGDNYIAFVLPQILKVNYLNPVVNSLSRYIVTTTGGNELSFYGLAFDQDDAELNDLSRSANNVPGTAWQSTVEFIYFEGLQGQGTYTLSRALGEFTVVSDTEINIPSMPAMTKGSYRIHLQKKPMTIDSGEVNAYAGAWRSHSNGEVFQGEEFNLFVVEPTHVAIKSGTTGLPFREPRRTDVAIPFLAINWRMKEIDGETYVYKHYAPIDTRGNETFRDGRLKSVSGLTRAINDETGLFISSDMTAAFSNPDKEFSKLLASHYMKGEPIELFTAFKDYPEAFKSIAFRGFVEDVVLNGQLFEAMIRDLTSVYFQRKVPLYRITKEEYPNCDPNFLGKPIPEAIGLLYHSADEASGAMEAAYVNTTNFTYLALRWIPHAITEVYNDGELVDPANYAIYQDGLGRTYIQFSSDQEESKITFNCKGYEFEPWNSANGYVQHPIYVLLYFLAFIMEVPLSYIDLDFFEEVKGILDALDPSIATSGYWGTMEEGTAEETIKELILTIGAALFPDRFGRFKLAMKDISNIATSKFIYAQIDTKEHPKNDYGYSRGVNRVKIRWNFIPAAGIFKGSKQESRDDTLPVYSGNYQEDPDPIDIKWTTNETLVNNKIQNELYKRGAGYKRFSFSLDLNFIDYLDIYDSFRLQDPYGVSKTGAGEFGRYLYIEKIEYDYEGHKMNIEALDLSYLMRRYLVLGSEDEHASNWSSASEEDKAFAYLSNEVTGKFFDGETGKILVDENRLRGI